MICAGGDFCPDIKQSFPDDKYTAAIRGQFERMGIGYRMSRAIGFSTPADALVKNR